MQSSILPLSKQDIDATAAITTPPPSPAGSAEQLFELHEVLPAPWRPQKTTKVQFDYIMSYLRGDARSYGCLRLVHMDTGSAGPWADDMRVDYIYIYKILSTKRYIIGVANNDGVFGGGGVDYHLEIENGSASLGDLLVTLYGPHVETQHSWVEKTRSGPAPPPYAEEQMALRLYNITFNEMDFDLDVHIVGAPQHLVKKAVAAEPAPQPKKLPIFLPSAAAAAPKMPALGAAVECV